ncbi:TPA: UDP-N-acetylglucosamine 1-carboxyvinyltransferase [Legionella pneumophila]
MLSKYELIKPDIGSSHGNITKVYEIVGGKPLRGQVKVSGSKNAALPVLAASLLCKEPLQLTNLPKILDVTNMIQCMEALGKRFEFINTNTIKIGNREMDTLTIPKEAARQIRASIILLGPLVAQYPKVILPLPGGCSIGKRPIDLHISALNALGVDIVELPDCLVCSRRYARLQGNTINFSIKTVTGTENAMMAAVLAEGTTIINNAAMEPEIVDLANFLNRLGAKIDGAGSDRITISGVDKLNSCGSYSIMADRIEAGTYLVAAAMTRGSISVKGVNPDYLVAVLSELKCAGAKITCDSDSIQLDMGEEYGESLNITSKPYPGFPTDLQSLFLSLTCVLRGNSYLCETLFEDRFQIVQELKKMGANISLKDNTAHIKGVSRLRGSQVNATDLRSGAALVCASLAAEGITQIFAIEHIERGYEDLILKLKALGANIKLIENTHVTSTELSDSHFKEATSSETRIQRASLIETVVTPSITTFGQFKRVPTGEVTELEKQQIPYLHHIM